MKVLTTQQILSRRQLRATETLILTPASRDAGVTSEAIRRGNGQRWVVSQQIYRSKVAKKAADEAAATAAAKAKELADGIVGQSLSQRSYAGGGR